MIHRVDSLTRHTDRLIRRLGTTEPDVVALAEVVSLAVRVDPALLRAARRAFLPHRGPDLEADLWHSPLVSASSRTGIAFDQKVAERLLYRLARRRERCEQARAVVVAAHGGLADDTPGWAPDTVRVEEHLRYLALVADGHRQARELLQDVHEQVNPPGGQGLQAWYDGLVSRMPLGLDLLASLGALGEPTPPERGERPGRPVAAEPGEQIVGLRLLDNGLEFRPIPYGSMHRLRLPAGLPPAVFVEGRLVPLEVLPHVEPLDDARTVAVQALDGTGLVLRRRRRQAVPSRQDKLTGHTADVWGCAFSPDGSLLVTTSNDHTARLWDTATGTPLHPLTGHQLGVRGCAFSPTGLTVATAGTDRTVRLWDASSGGVLFVLYAHERSVESCAFSPDGKLLATTSSDGTARLWAVETLVPRPAQDAPPVPERVLEGHSGPVWKCAFSPDGAMLATVGSDGTVRVWDPGPGTERHRLTGHADVVVECAFSPDGRMLATTGRDRTVRLWDPVAGTHLRTLEGHTNSVLGCAFSPDGALLATTGNDQTVRLWDPINGAELTSFPGHRSRVRSCAFSPDGSVLVSVGADKSVRLWDPRPVRPPQRLLGHTSWIYSCHYTPDGSLLATAGADGTIRLWDPPTGRPVRTLLGHDGSVEWCAFAPDGKTLASAGSDGLIRIWPTTGTEARQVLAQPGQAPPVHRGAFSADSRMLAATASDGTVRLWDLGAGRLLGTLEGHTGPVHGAAFSPDGGMLATAGADKTVRVWDPQERRRLVTLTGHIREVLDCAFSPDGRWLASASSDQTVRLWDPIEGATRHILRGHTGRIHACVFSPDGSLLATGSADGTVHLWDPERGQLVDVITGPHGLLDHAFSPDGTHVVVAGAGPVVSVWDLRTRQVAVKGDTVGLWLGGLPGDAAAVAGAVAARPFTAVCSPVVASGGGALPGVLLAAGVEPRHVVDRLVGTAAAAAAAGAAARWLARWRDPVRRLARLLARQGVRRCGDLRVPVEHPLHRHRFQAVVVDAASGDLVVLPRDAARVGLRADDIPLAELAVAASGLRPEVVLGGRVFQPAVGVAFDPGPWWDGAPAGRRVLAVDVEGEEGTVPARRFPPSVEMTTVTIPWTRVPAGAVPPRRQREVLARIGAQSLRDALPAEPPGRSGHGRDKLGL